MINLLFFTTNTFKEMKKVLKKSNTQEKWENRYNKEIKNKENIEIIVK
jgi:hypothetical protein